MRMAVFLAAGMLAGCAASPPAPTVSPAPTASPAAKAPPDACRAEVDRLSALLAGEVAERQRLTRAATRREEALRKQLDAMKAIERGILEREDRVRSETR